MRVRVMGRGSPAMYLLIYWTFSKNKNWSFFAHVPSTPTGLGRGARFALRVSVVDAPRLTPAFTVKLHRTPNSLR